MGRPRCGFCRLEPPHWIARRPAPRAAGRAGSGHDRARSASRRAGVTDAGEGPTSGAAPIGSDSEDFRTCARRRAAQGAVKALGIRPHRGRLHAQGARGGSAPRRARRPTRRPAPWRRWVLPQCNRSITRACSRSVVCRASRRWRAYAARWASSSRCGRRRAFGRFAATIGATAPRCGRNARWVRGSVARQFEAPFDALEPQIKAVRTHLLLGIC